MSRVLLLGGYGGFGARLAQRLAAQGFTVLVAGRRLEAARDFCAGLPGSRPVRADRAGDLGPVLAAERPDLVIDAAGPFQGSSYRVPEACIAAGIPYLDLADARDFVAGIGRLDAAARAAGVAVVAGASSVPALSGAMARDLARGMERVTAVEIAISASARATVGPSVAAAILSGVGRPFRRWWGGRWQDAAGWSGLRRVVIDDGAGRPLRRLVALVDVPDLEVLPPLLPGAPSVSFRAGPEFTVQTLALWLLGFLVRFGWLRSLLPLARGLRAGQAVMARAGGDRSGMAVTLRGFAGGRGLERSWMLVARDGCGPEIPTLAAAILAGRMASLPPGARDAAGLLAPADFAPLFAAMAIGQRVVERDVVPLYARVLGPGFERLPPAVAAIHLVVGVAGAAGAGEVTRGRGPLARLICALMRFPPAGRHALHVTFEVTGDAKGERWTRDFGGYRFSSRLGQWRGCLTETFGPLRFAFDLPCDEAGLAMVLRGWSAFGLPLPRALAPRIAAREWQEGEDFHFDVALALPLFGPLIRYRGSLSPRQAAFAAPAT